MKKCIAIICALALILAFTGCVSQSDYDALAASNADLEAKIADMETQIAALEDENSTLEAEYAILEVSHSSLQDDYDELMAARDALYEQANAATMAEAELTMFSGWAGIISDTYGVGALDDNTVCMMVYAEDRDFNTFVEEVGDWIYWIHGSLAEDGFTDVVILGMKNAEQVWFGYTVTIEGNVTAFIDEEML